MSEFWSIIISILIGVPFGIISSLAAWWIIQHKVTPKIGFEKSIGRVLKRNVKDPYFRYRVRISNIGGRNIHELKVRFRIAIKGFNSEVPDNWSMFYINSKNPGSSILSAGNQLVIPIQYDNLPIKLKNIVGKEHWLDDILAIENCSMRVFVSGTDELSGTKRLFQSEIYYKESLTSGYYSKSPNLQKVENETWINFLIKFFK